jgi:hypothetical protein
VSRGPKELRYEASPSAISKADDRLGYCACASQIGVRAGLSGAANAATGMPSPRLPDEVRQVQTRVITRYRESHIVVASGCNAIEVHKMSVPNSRNWKAVEEPNLEGGGYRVRVTGEVEAESPSLHARVPQGLDPRILMLDLSKVDEGSDYQEVQFREPSEVHSFDQVDIFFLGQEVSRITVEQSESTTRQDRKDRGERPKRRREKAVKKKTAKKRSKKTSKRKMKKAANRTAKRSTEKKSKRKSKKKSAKRASRKKRI